MDGGGIMACGRRTARMKGLVRVTVLLSTAIYAGAQETCTSVTVTGGDFPGDYELGEGDVYVGTDDSTHVLQPVVFAESRARRNLVGGAGDGGGGGGSGSRRRGLANDCASQMWILADTGAVEEEGFPYYSTFDCATHPASVESTWLYVDCDDCAEVATISVVCTSSTEDAEDVLTSGDGGDGGLTLPVIIAIAAGVLIVLLCLGFCVVHRKKRAHKGSHTFADDSQHSLAQQKRAGKAGAGGAAVAGGGGGATAAAGGNGAVPLPAYTGAVGESVESPMAAGGAMGDGGDRGVGGDGRSNVRGGGGGSGRSGAGLLAKGSNAKSFKPNHGGANTPAYEGMFAPRGGGGGGGGGGAAGGAPGSSQGTATTSTALPHPAAVEMSNYAKPVLRKDSMAAAAAAAAGGTSSSGGRRSPDPNPPPAFASVLSSGVVDGGNRPPQEQRQQQQQPRQAGGGIVWSAGQNVGHRRGYDQSSEIGGDSAAGSVYDLQPPAEDLEHSYHQDGYDDSVAASSPGAYSIYSHYTAGGGMYTGGVGGNSEAWSDDDGGSSYRPPGRTRGGGGGGGGGGGRGGGDEVPSPAGMMARADRNR